MRSYVVVGSGEQKLMCGIDLDIVVYGAESAIIENNQLVFRDKDGVEVRRFAKHKYFYCSGEWDDRSKETVTRKKGA